MKEKNILIVVAHSDDETIGMGGTIKRHHENGDKVYAISMTDGVSSRKENASKKSDRVLASQKASEILNFKWEKRFDYSDNQMDKFTILEVTRNIEEIKLTIKPDIVYTHSNADLNVDHRIVSHAVLTAFRPQPKETCREIRLFEINSSTDYGHKDITGDFTPNLFINISKTWDSKLQALYAYTLEMREYPHSRSFESIKNLAKRRGNQVGIEMAEAFQILRRVEI